MPTSAAPLFPAPADAGDDSSADAGRGILWYVTGIGLFSILNCIRVNLWLSQE